MTNEHLQGKKVFIFSADARSLNPVYEKLYQEGADQVKIHLGPVRSNNVDKIVQQVKDGNPDVVLIYNPNVGLGEVRGAITDIAEELKGKTPLVVQDMFPAHAAEYTKMRQETGIVCLHGQTKPEETIFKLSEAIRQHGIASREVE